LVSGGTIRRIEEGGKNARNMSKTIEVHQGPDESLRHFYEQLYEAFYLYTPFNPEALEDLRMIHAAFVSLAQGDIKRNLKNLEGFTGMNVSQFLEVATKVFDN
jgi:hypothetical protein